MQDFLDWAAAGSDEQSLARLLVPERLPRHIAVIMDGNGRWARRRLLPRAAGHRAGVRPVRETIEACCRLGVEALTLYAFSVENWKRPQHEISTLWALLRKYLRQELPDLKANNVRFQTAGHLDALPAEVCRDIDHAIVETAANTGLCLTIALNYSGRAEIIDAVNAFLRQSWRLGEPLQVDEDEFGKSLWTAGVGDPDLLIRTSGEFRLSNFLLWQLAYTEIWVTPRFWPDFRTTDLLEALVEFQRRERRFGGLPAGPSAGRGGSGVPGAELLAASASK